MAEVSFVKTFLAILDTKPQKISADHVEDPRHYPSRTPYILPRMPKPMSKPLAQPTAPGAERRVTVTVKALRGSASSDQQPGGSSLDVRLPAQAPTTSVLDVKTAVAARAGLPAARLRLLHNKKPVPDSKALRDLLPAAGAEAGAGEATVEFSVMVMGGGTATKPAAGVSEAGAAVAQGLSGTAVLETEGFWADLQGFLQQRIRDEKTAEEVCGQFRRAWINRG